MAIALVVSTSVCGAGTRSVRYVDADALPGGTGLSWTSAHRDLRDALEVAGATTDIWIAQGMYRADRALNDRSASFVVPAGVRLFGGFVGGETSVLDRQPGVHVTELTGDIGVLNDPSDNSFHVMRIGAGANVMIDGVMIVGGLASGAAFPDDSGGGVLVDGSSPTFVSCVFIGNGAKYGGGLFVRNGSPTVIDCQFQQNTSSQDGGGAVLRSGGLVQRSFFAGNTGVFGGGLLTCCGPARVEDSTFIGNFANKGGGVYVPVGALTLVRVGLQGNSAIEGGGLYTAANGTTAAACKFAGNTAQLGGGVYMGSAAHVVNCVFSRNFASASGGAVHSTAAIGVYNSTLWSNSALNFGGGVYSVSGNTSVSNTIFWSNSDSTGTTTQGAQFTRVTGTPTFASCCVQGWNGTLSGVNCINSGPQFADPDGVDDVPGTLDDDLQLAAGSPCIDRGDNSAIPSDVADLDGDASITEPLPMDIVGRARRIDDALTPDLGIGLAPIVDIGAYEFKPTGCPGDANGDDLINAADLSVLLGSFGSPVQIGVGADFNRDGVVNGSDLSVLLAVFGTLCPNVLE